MPPAKSRFVHEDSRSEGSTAKEKQVTAAAHARKGKNGISAQQNGSSLKELALVQTESGNVVAPGQGAGVRCLTTALMLAARLTHDSTDAMEHCTSRAAEQVPSRTPPLHSRRVHITSESSTPHEPGNRPSESNDGTKEREEAIIKREARFGCPEELQCRCCKRDRCGC